MSRGTPEEHRDFTGDGNRVVRVGTIDSPLLMFFDAPTAGLTSVWALDSDGVQVQLLVNSLEPYQGVTLILAEVPVVGLQVRSDGPWSIRIRPLSAARPWPGATLSARGDDVLRLTHPAIGFTTAAMRVTEASGNTSVWAFGSERRTLLFNEIGPFASETVVPPGTNLITVRCEGHWSMQLEASAPTPTVIGDVDARRSRTDLTDVRDDVNRLCEAFAAQHRDLGNDDWLPEFYWACPHFAPWAEAHFVDAGLRQRIRTTAESTSGGVAEEASAALRLLRPGVVSDSFWSGVAAAAIASEARAFGGAAVDALAAMICAQLERPSHNRHSAAALARMVEGMCALEFWWTRLYDDVNYLPMRDVESWWPRYMRVVDTWLTADDLNDLSQVAGYYTDTEALSSVTAADRLAVIYGARPSAVCANPRLPADIVNANLSDDWDLLFHPNANLDLSWAVIRAALENGFDDAYGLSAVCIPFSNMRDDSWAQFSGFATNGPHTEVLRTRIRAWCLANMSDEDELEELLESFGC